MKLTYYYRKKLLVNITKLGNNYSKRNLHFSKSILDSNNIKINNDENYIKEKNIFNELPVEHKSSNNEIKNNEILLQQVFDDNKIWKLFSNKFKNTFFNKNKGLFCNPYLTSSKGILEFTEVSLKRAKKLVQEIYDLSSVEEYKNIIKLFDELSDVLCQVLDMTSFVRIAHPDNKYIEASDRSQQAMFDFMNHLNVDQLLHHQLNKALTTPNIRLLFSPEEIVVGEILLYDFNKSGVELPLQIRKKFVELSSKANIYEREVISSARLEKSSLTFKCDELNSIDSKILEQLPSKGSNITLPVNLNIDDMISNSHVRKALYLARNRVSNKQIDNLNKLLKTRAELAKLIGYNSFSDYELTNKMIKTPINATRFLQQLSKVTYLAGQAELEKISNLDLSNSKFNAWDLYYYRNKYVNTHPEPTSPLKFTIGSVFRGISHLYTNIYGIKLIPKEPLPGEIWSPDVRRVDVVSETDGLLGVIYLDLFYRSKKVNNPAHYCIRLSRKLDSLKESDAPEYMTVKSKSGEITQLPTIVLVCGFSSKSSNMISHDDIETLFHELGHAMHSMIGRTKLLNVSGTRCATDFVEIPSTLMENFAANPQVLRQCVYSNTNNSNSFTKYDYDEDAKKRENIPTEHFLPFQHKPILHYVYSHDRVCQSILDLVCHGPLALKDNFQVLDAYKDVQTAYGLFPYVEGDNGVGLLSHFASYPSTYYSYLLDRVIANNIWEHLFANNPFSRESGEKMCEQMLKWGGARDPWLCVAGVLDRPDLAGGDWDAIQKLVSGKEVVQ